MANRLPGAVERTEAGSEIFTLSAVLKQVYENLAEDIEKTVIEKGSKLEKYIRELSSALN